MQHWGGGGGRGHEGSIGRNVNVVWGMNAVLGDECSIGGGHKCSIRGMNAVLGGGGVMKAVFRVYKIINPNCW